MNDTLIKASPNQFIRIAHPDEPVYRIFPLWFLEETLRLHQLALISPHLWEDPFEVVGSMIAVNWLEGGRSKQVIINQSLPPVYAQCWSMTTESDTLLRAYSRVVKDPQFRRNICPREEGVRVQSTPRKLLEVLLAGVQSEPEVSCFIGSVQYLEQTELLQQIANAIGFAGLDAFENPANRAKLLLMKREAFAHEAEVRMMAIHHRSGLSDSISWVPIDPNAVFDEITFDPRLETFERMEREISIRNLGYAGPLRGSQLYEPVELQVLLERPPKKG